MNDDIIGNDKLGLLRRMALIVIVAGAVGSLGFVLHAGRNNRSIFLVALFVAWVLSPFAGFVVANVVSKHWSVRPRAMLYILMLLVTLGSLIGYSGAVSPHGTKPAFVFLFVPLLSWILMAIAYFIGNFRNQNKFHRSKSR